MKGFIVDIQFIWGFQSRIIGLSKTNPSFYYPPPTTFLGALSAVIAKRYSFGEKKGLKVIEALSQNVLAIGLRPMNCIPLKYQDINRIIAVRIRSGKLYPIVKDPWGSFDSPARGKTILSSLDDDPPTIRWFIIFEKEEISVDNEEIPISNKYFWEINRLGSKESVVSVKNVQEIIESDLKMHDNRVITNYSFPLDNGVNPRDAIEESWVREIYLNPRKGILYRKDENPLTYYLKGEKTSVYYLPILSIGGEEIKPPKYEVIVSRPFTAYQFGEEVIIGCQPTS